MIGAHKKAKNRKSYQQTAGRCRQNASCLPRRRKNDGENLGYILCNRTCGRLSGHLQGEKQSGRKHCRGENGTGNKAEWEKTLW